MNASFSPITQGAPAGCQKLPAFNLVLLHDDELTAKAAERVIARLILHPLRQTDTHQDHWTFEELSHPGFRKEALELAKPCDLMVVATIANGSLPLHVRSWIRSWNETRSQKEAAFVFLSKFRNALIDASEELSELEATDNLVVLTSALVLPKGANAPVPQRRASSIARYVPRPECWGINE